MDFRQTKNFWSTASLLSGLCIPVSPLMREAMDRLQFFLLLSASFGHLFLKLSSQWLQITLKSHLMMFSAKQVKLIFMLCETFFAHLKTL